VFRIGPIKLFQKEADPTHRLFEKAQRYASNDGDSTDKRLRYDSEYTFHLRSHNKNNTLSPRTGTHLGADVEQLA